jgi:HD-GYP domain-containing protein (c-di-GMP phosphodiesterase class II)
MNRTVKRISVNQLEIGMYICRIERGWLDVPYWLQQTAIDSADTLERIKQCCEYVYIDTSKGKDVRAASAAKPAPATRRTESAGPSGPAHPSTLYHNSRTVLENVFEDARLGRSIDGMAARKAVRDLTLNIISDANAMLCLAHLQDKNDSLARKAVNACILTLAFGKHIGVAKARLHDLGMGALLHDVGMVRIPDELLLKSGQLTAAERKTIEQHVLHGLKLLAATRGCNEDVLKIVQSHHEHIDGSGYPQGLKGNTISLFSRMVAITSVYEAMTRQRSYGEALSPVAAIKHLHQQRGKTFDERLVDKFIQTIGIYPPGSLVELSNGAIALVLNTHSDCRLRPLVQLVADRDKQPLLDGPRLDLQRLPGQKIHISGPADPHAPNWQAAYRACRDRLIHAPS